MSQSARGVRRSIDRRGVGCYFGVTATWVCAMSSSTTLKLPAELKDRVAEAAEAAGRSPHAFMVEAIEAQTRLAERRREFVASALEAEREVVQSGLVYDGDEVLSYLQSKLSGEPVRRPRRRKA